MSGGENRVTNTVAQTVSTSDRARASSELRSIVHQSLYQRLLHEHSVTQQHSYSKGLEKNDGVRLKCDVQSEWLYRELIGPPHQLTHYGLSSFSHANIIVYVHKICYCFSDFRLWPFAIHVWSELPQVEFLQLFRSTPTV